MSQGENNIYIHSFISWKIKICLKVIQEAEEAGTVLNGPMDQYAGTAYWGWFLAKIHISSCWTTGTKLTCDPPFPEPSRVHRHSGFQEKTQTYRTSRHQLSQSRVTILSINLFMLPLFFTVAATATKSPHSISQPSSFFNNAYPLKSPSSRTAVNSLQSYRLPFHSESMLFRSTGCVTWSIKP